MRCGVLILPEDRWPKKADTWRTADQLGFDSAWTYDHLWWTPLSSRPWFSAFPVLAAAACVTERIQLGTMVTSPNFRNPVVTAKEALTLDDISGGRLMLGVGAGSETSADARALGGCTQSRVERTDRFTEFVELIDKLLRSDNAVTYHGRFYSAIDVLMTPGCVQQPRVPLAVAATGPRGFNLAARLGEAWVTLGPPALTTGYSADDILQMVSRQAHALRRVCERVGRHFGDLDRIYLATDLTGDTLTSPDAFLSTAERYAKAGISHFILHWPRPAGLYAGDPEALVRIAEEALPEVRALVPSE
jgi:alkanesulfonate monooxygenase SsuD/methylene tetrahydromethanopterin reductase-like flavin-dependent oxidoreductase (luciferase family)